jgi:hypothetical protein
MDSMAAQMASLDWLPFNYFNFEEREKEAAVRTSPNSGT